MSKEFKLYRVIVAKVGEGGESRWSPRQIRATGYLVDEQSTLTLYHNDEKRATFAAKQWQMIELVEPAEA